MAGEDGQAYPKGTLLIVDDEEPVRKLMVTILADEGYQVLEASDGESAMDVSARFEGKIDLLITDLKMPRMGGKALAERLCRTRPDLKILYISGYTDDEVQGLIACGDKQLHFQAKPFTGTLLKGKVEGILLS